MTQTLRTATMATACVVFGLGAAATADAHVITVADLPAGYTTARLMPPFPGGLVPMGATTEMFLQVQNTSLFDARITALGFNLPGDFPAFTLTSSTSPAFTLANDVGGVSGVGGATLDFALLTGLTFNNGNLGSGIAPGQTVSFSVIGPFPSTFGFERILDFVVVRFEQVGPTGTQTGTGFGPSAAVPEPATIALLGIGFAACGVARRRSRSSRLRIAQILMSLGLTVLMAGCGNSAHAPTSPSTPTPPNPTPTPAPTAANLLSGMVFEVTSTGRSALGGVTVELLTCGAANCPGGLTADYEVKTGEDGSYRIPGVYSGELNYLWILNDTYELADPMAPGTCPDRCDRIVTVSGDTRLDIDLVRR